MLQTIFGSISPPMVAIFIPVIAIAGGIGIAIVAVIMDGRQKELVHKERLLAMEKGIELLPEPLAKPQRPSYIGNRNAGLVVLFLGIALTIALSVVEGWNGGVWGLLPVAIGAGLLVAAYLEQREIEASGNR